MSSSPKSVIYSFNAKMISFKVEYFANENQLKHSEKIAYVGQRLMYPIIKKNTLPCYLKKNAITFLGFYIKNISFNKKYIAKITNPITKPQFLTIIKLTYIGIK